MAIVAGVDGCRGGWLAAMMTIGEPATASVRIAPSFAVRLEIARTAQIIAVDMPIGLPERSGPGGRPCDIAARARLGERQSAVFAVPSRRAVMEADYRAACEAALQTSDPPRKVSKQCFNLFPKIREIDRLMTPMLQERVRECHPEAAFVELNGGGPLREPKKVKSRPYEQGLTLRRGLLKAAGFTAAFLEGEPPPGAGSDDVLDAAACCWSAARIVSGAARRFPSDPPRDVKGLRMEIWA